MKLLRIPRAKFSTLYDNEQYDSFFFGNMISSTADADTTPIWDANATYTFMDKVKISSLQTTYTAKVDNPKGYPAISNDWFEEGTNPYKMLDSTFSTKTVFSNDCVVEFNVNRMTHLLGRGVENAKEILFEYFDHQGNNITQLFDCDSCAELVSMETMTYDEEFNCFSCCNPDPVEKHSFAVEIPRERCEELAKIKVTITKADANLPIRISTMVVASAYNFGCVQSGFEISDKIPAKIYEYPQLQATGIRFANISTRMSGNIRVDAKDVDTHRKIKARHSGWLNYYLFDDLDEVVKSGLVLGIATDSKYTFNSSNNITMSIDVVGVEH